MHIKPRPAARSFKNLRSLRARQGSRRATLELNADLFAKSPDDPTLPTFELTSLN